MKENTILWHGLWHLTILGWLVLGVGIAGFIAAGRHWKVWLATVAALIGILIWIIG